MSGSHDRLANMPPGVDQVGPRESDPVASRESDPITAELRERMERLPPGHPSSPYNDDGSRKPPLPDLSDYELPIPGDPDYQPEPSGASEADHPEAAQTPEYVRPGTNPDEGPERTADQTELWDVPPDAESPTDAPGEVSQEEREALREATADDRDERTVNELPHLGDPDYQPDLPRASEADDIGDVSADDIDNYNSPAADRSPERGSSPSDQEGLGDLDSEEREERRLSEITDRAVEKCREAEGRDADGNYGEQGLTPAMRRIESQLEHGHLADQTEKYALKDPARFKEKLAQRIKRFPNADPNDLAAKIHDGVRYTFILEFDHYTGSVGLAQSKLSEAGYDQIETKPGWHGEEYKGVNSQWEDPASGIRFEVQFHTNESWRAKQTTHEAYETIRTNQASIEEMESLRSYQREVSATIQIPPGALNIPAYKKGR